MIETVWERCVRFHGHECPGLAIGVKACEAAQLAIGITFSPDEEVVCITENDICAVDAIQVITGCTLGKGNLIYRGTGKIAFSFFNRSTGASIRLVWKDIAGPADRIERRQQILSTPGAELFESKPPGFALPGKARLFTTIRCERCGEGAPEHKIRLLEGKRVCLDCYPEYTRGWDKK